MIWLYTEAKSDLLIIYSNLFFHDITPKDWMTVDKVPIHKRDDNPTDPAFYGIISLPSCAGLLMERMIAEGINLLLENKHILTTNQFGFRSGLCTPGHSGA